MFNGKPLAELQSEIDLGMRVYPSTNHDVVVSRINDGINDRYVFARIEIPDLQEEGVTLGTVREKPGINKEYVIGFFMEKDGSGGIFFPLGDTYETFQALLKDWPFLASQPIWSTCKVPECAQWEEMLDKKIAIRDAGCEEIQEF